MRKHLLMILAIVLCVPAAVHATCGGGGGGGMGGMMPASSMDPQRGGRPDAYVVPWKVLKADDAPLNTPSTGMNITSVHPYTQQIVKGIVVIVAVALTIDRKKYAFIK